MDNCSVEGQERYALVLAGGAARGAYEVGVVLHLLEEVARDLGHEVPLDILCGTSVGALNACMLAGFADRPRERGVLLQEQWRRLRIEEVIHPDRSALFEVVRGLFGAAPRPIGDEERRGGILHPAAIERIVRTSVPWGAIPAHLAAGRLHGLTVSTTHVASGRTVVFVETQGRILPVWKNDPTVEARRVTIGPDHALASAAIPFLFPAVRIEGEFYVDGGLRQNVPLSPARRLGATALVVVSPRYIPPPQVTPEEAREREAAFPGPLFLLGKALNALLLDRIENDLDRLERINELLHAGCRRYGPGFLEAINEELGHRPAPTRPLRTVLIRASTDIGRMATEYVESAQFKARTSGLLGRVMRRLAESTIESDLLSYLLFDGEFAERLIQLGRRDAAAQHAELVALFAPVVEKSRAVTS
jgi:NTE family protein